MKIWVDFIKPAVILSVICATTSALLALTNDVTAPIIEDNNIRTANEARMALLPAEGFELVEGEFDGVSEVYKATDGSGYVISAAAKGYSGDVPVMVAIADGKILGTTFLANTETPGLGQKVRDDKFKEQFTQLDAGVLTLSDIDVIAGATISTNAAIAAVNSAVAAYLELSGEGAAIDYAAFTEQEVHDFVLPDSGALTEIEVNGADKAYKGESYGTILYVSENGFFAKPLTAVVGFNDDGTIKGVWFNAENESDGYGSQVTENEAFLQQFIGAEKDSYEIIAGATTSSNAAVQAVKTACDIYEQQIKGGA